MAVAILWHVFFHPRSCIYRLVFYCVKCVGAYWLDVLKCCMSFVEFHSFVTHLWRNFSKSVTIHDCFCKQAVHIQFSRHVDCLDSSSSFLPCLLLLSLKAKRDASPASWPDPGPVKRKAIHTSKNPDAGPLPGTGDKAAAAECTLSDVRFITEAP